MVNNAWVGVVIDMGCSGSAQGVAAMVHSMYLGAKIFGVHPGFLAAFGMQTILAYLRFLLVDMLNTKPCT